MKHWNILTFWVAGMLLLLASGCNQRPSSPAPKPPPAAPLEVHVAGAGLQIAAGSENRSLEPLIQQRSEERRVGKEC